MKSIRNTQQTYLIVKHCHHSFSLKTVNQQCRTIRIKEYDKNSKNKFVIEAEMANETKRSEQYKQNL